MNYGAPVHYYQDDGLGGLGGDDGLGGLGQPAPQQQYEEFGDDGLFLLAPPPMEEQPAAENPDDADAELDEALEGALFGNEATQTTSQLDSSKQQRTASDDDDDDVSTEDEVLDDGDEQTGGRTDAVVVEAEPQQEDPAALESQRQNAWYKECFDAMTEVQRNRLEAYIRSNLQKKTMKKVLQELTGGMLNEKVVVAISSITKMFVGELVETARQIAARQGHTGALLPNHIRQAYNALSADGRVPHRAHTKPLRLR